MQCLLQYAGYTNAPLVGAFAASAFAGAGSSQAAAYVRAVKSAQGSQDGPLPGISRRLADPVLRPSCRVLNGWSKAITISA